MTTNNEKTPGGESYWTYRWVAVYGSRMHFIAGCPLFFPMPIYAIFLLKGIKIHGLVCFRNVGILVFIKLYRHL